nr:hypothetical protein [Tanacetum cinerariifolium]
MDVAAVAKDVKDAEIEESSDVYGRKEESQALELLELSMQEDDIEPAKLQEVVEVVTTTKLITEVVTAAGATITVAAPQLTTAAAPTLTTAPNSARRRTRVIEQDEAYARELEAELNKNIDWDEVIYQVKRKEKEENTKEPIEEEDSKALKRINKSQEDKAAKKQKLDEKVEELRKHLQIVPNDDDDVNTEATPLVLKVPVVDYKIYTENNKPYYKIKRADRTH